MSDKKTKAYIYTRVSTAMQVEGYSLDAQKERMRTYAKSMDIEIAGEYEDAGRSGKSISGRPEFQRMIRDIEDQKDNVSFVLVFKLSRFGRSAADVLNTLQIMQDHGVNLICVEDGIDSSKEAGKLVLTVMSAVAEMERENIAAQTMEDRRQKAREGKWNGDPAPFGYSIMDGSLVINEEEAKIVRLIFDKYVNEEVGFATIVKWLNEKGYKKSRDKADAFSVSYVTKLIDNPVYYSLVLGRSDYQWQHEPVLYGFLQNGKHKWYSDRKQTTIWNFAKPKRNADHPTSKPLDLLSYPIGNSTQENAVVIDTFGGSGSTLMACEKMNRICCTMELDEKYASVILRRYVEDTGDADGVYVIRNGKKIPYSDLVKEVERSG